MRIEVVVDELVLIGFEPHDRHRIADALSRELATCVTRAQALTLSRADTDLSVLEAPHFTASNVAGQVSADAVGKGVAHSITTALGGAAK